MEEKQGITVRVIIEMLGSPKEHIEKTLKDYVERLKKDKTIAILKEDYVEAEEKGKMFSCFVELDIKFPSPEALIGFCFDAMPSSIDILEPAELVFDTKKLTDILNDLQARLHQVDMALKYLKAEKTILDTNVVTVFNNFVTYILKNSGDKKLDEISVLTGVKPEQLKNFLDKIVEKKTISLKDGVYSAAK